MKPNLFIIGAPKTGSTSLYHYLAEHPQVFMCADKEPHYFSQDLRLQCQQLHGKLIKFKYPSLDEYHALFQGSADKDIIGDASTSYLYSTSAAEDIHAYNPEAKIIAILREPVELLHSWFHYISYTSEEPAKTFAEALSLETKRKQNINNIPKSVWYPQRVYYRELIQFDKQLERYYDLFEKDNIKVILTEDLQNNPDKIYDELLDFLSLNGHKADFSRHNVYQEIRFKKIKWIIDNYLSGIKNFINNHPDSIVSRCANFLYSRTMSKDEKRPVIDQASDAELKELLTPMVKRTQELTGLNLVDKWRY